MQKSDKYWFPEKLYLLNISRSFSDNIAFTQYGFWSVWYESWKHQPDLKRNITKIHLHIPWSLLDGKNFNMCALQHH